MGAGAGYPRGLGLVSGFMLIVPPSNGMGAEMAVKREKTISYRRAEWLDPNWPDLETNLRTALKKLKTVSERSLVQGDQFARMAQQADGPGGGLLLHITTETPGESASVVPKVAAASSGLDLKSQKPPPDGEWLDGDAFLYVNGDHVCICSTAVHDTAVKTFLWDFFKKAKLDPNAGKFDLIKVADIGKVKMLKAQGVKELEIRGTLFAATASYENRKAQAQSMLGAAASLLRFLLQLIFRFPVESRERASPIAAPQPHALAPRACSFFGPEKQNTAKGCWLSRQVRRRQATYHGATQSFGWSSFDATLSGAAWALVAVGTAFVPGADLKMV
jgi:hypothetical protein